MEIYGIILSIPAAFVCGAIYSIVIEKLTIQWQKITTPLVWGSGIILALISLEVLGVITVGILQMRKLIGPAYYLVHIFLFLGTLPSIVNIMKIQRRIPLLSRWYLIGSTCAIIGFGIVLLQYGVSETLYGINGTEGPYGKP